MLVNILTPSCLRRGTGGDEIPGGERKRGTTEWFRRDVVVVVIIIIDRFYIALFSAFEQTHCARM